MKIEKIVANAYQRKLFHVTSSGMKDIKMKGKEGEIEALAYIEDYVTQSGFKIESIFSGTAGVITFILTKE
ncbi:MAG: hypothetical protein ACFFCS_19570 [Candidatus Hodarchaeota archaeon]